MSFLKFVLYSLIAYVAFRFFVSLAKPAPVRRTSPREPRSAGRTIRCNACGVFVPEKNALILGGSAFCSTACVEKVAKTQN